MGWHPYCLLERRVQEFRIGFIYGYQRRGNLRSLNREIEIELSWQDALRWIPSDRGISKPKRWRDLFLSLLLCDVIIFVACTFFTCSLYDLFVDNTAEWDSRQPRKILDHFHFLTPLRYSDRCVHFRYFFLS